MKAKKFIKDLFEVELEKEQYGPKVDKIIYSDLTKGFTEDDWIALGVAALDQGGFPDKEVDNFVAKLRK
jgi:hypothetical protein